MMEPKKETKVDETYTFPRYKAYSVDEILAAGGTTAFAIKMGKNPENISKRLTELSEDTVWTEQEVREALATLNANK